jgi:uncharacterized protein (DUF983 family)
MTNFLSSSDSDDTVPPFDPVLVVLVVPVALVPVVSFVEVELDVSVPLTAVVAVSVLLLFSLFLQANASSAATQITTRIPNLVFLMQLLLL